MALIAKSAFLALGLNYGVHYTSARLYDTFCIPHSIHQLLQSFITTASPACGLLLNAMQITQTNYGSVLTVTLTSLLTSALKSS